MPGRINRNSFRNFFKRTWPIPAAIVVVSFFYWIHIVHLPAESIPFVLAPVVISNLIFAFLLNLYFRRSIQSERKPVGTLVLSAAFCGILYFFELRHLSLWLGLATIGVFIWILISFLLGLAGQFYVGFAGVALFTIILLSYRALDILEINYIVRKIHGNEQKKKGETRIFQWIGEVDGKLALLVNGDLLLRMQVPDGMEFTRNAKSDQGPVDGPANLFPAMGNEIGRLNPTGGLSGIPPYILILDPLYAEKPLIGEIRKEVELILGHMHSKYMIRDPKYVGEQEIAPLISGVQLSGPAWGYTMKDGKIPVRFGIYYPEDYEKKPLAFLIVEPVVEGFPHHPDILSTLSSLEWD